MERYKSIPHSIGSTKGYNIRNAYFVCFNGTGNSYEDAFQKIVKRNPTAKIVLAIANQLNGTVETIFNYAWKELQLINVMIVTLMNEQVFMYNPYNQTLFLVESTNLIDRLIESVFTNAQMYPLRVNQFYSIQICDAREVQGEKAYLSVCGELVDILRKSMNFTVVIVQPKDIPDFGFITPNGTYMGALGEIEYNRADISADMRLITDFNSSQNLYFLHPVFDIQYKFAVPVDYYLVDFEVMPHKFMEPIVLILISLTVSVLIFLHYLSDKIRISKSNFSKVTLTYAGAYVNASVNFNPLSMSTRLLFSLLLFLTLIVSNIYQGTIITQLNKVGGQTNIQTLEQLVSSNLQIRVPSGPDRYIQNFKTFPKRSIQNQLFKRMVVTETSSEIQIHWAAIERTAAIMIPNHYIYYYESKFLSNKTGRPAFYTVPDYPYSYFMSVMVQKRSPFIERFNYICLRAKEAALFDHQYNLGLYRMKMLSIRRTKEGLVAQETTKTIGIKEMQTFFLYYAGAMAVTFVIFLLEFIAHRLERKWLIYKLRARVKTHQRGLCEICSAQTSITYK